MTNTIFADLDIEGLIWLVIIVIWVLAQLLNAARSAQKKRGSLPSQRRESEGRQEAQPGQHPMSLPEFLEDILHQQQPRTVKPIRTRVAKPVQSQYQKLKPIPRKAKAPDADSTEGEACYYAHKEKSDFIASTGMESFKLQTINLPTLRSSFSLTKIRKKSRVNLNLRNDSSFKRAVISRTVLGPPKSIQGDAYLNRD